MVLGKISNPSSQGETITDHVRRFELTRSLISQLCLLRVAAFSPLLIDTTTSVYTYVRVIVANNEREKGVKTEGEG